MKKLVSVNLVTVDMIFPLEGKRGVVAAVKKLPGLAKEREDGALRGVVLASSDETLYFARYAYDEASKEIDSPLPLFKVTLRLRPETPPPRNLIEGRERGETVEALLVAAQALLETYGVGTCVLEARLRTPAGSFTLPSVISPPLATDGSVLELVGATYRAASTPKKGPFFLSWYHDEPPDTLAVRLGSIEPSLTLAPSNPWEAVATRCGQLLAAMS